MRTTELQKLTKSELIQMIVALEDDIRWKEKWESQQEDLISELKEQLNYTIKDLDNFKFRLSLNGALTSQVEREIDEYMRYYNY